VAITQQRDDLADDFGLSYRRVFVKQCVTRGDQQIAVDADNAMRDQRFVAAIEDQLARLQPGEATLANLYNIAWPDSGDHACAGDPEAHLAEAAGYLCNQLTSCRRACV